MSMIRTPELVPKVLELCRQMNPTARPVFIHIAPAPGAQPNDCFHTVQHKVTVEGGRIQFGWAIWEWPNVYIEAEHHAVYESPAGPPWVDITPDPHPEITRRLFLPDDTATYDFENEGVRRDNVRMALVNDPLVLEFFRLAEEHTAILNAVPGIGAVVIEGEAAVHLERNTERLQLVISRLGMKYTPRNALCFCGSGKKFKHCCGH